MSWFVQKSFCFASGISQSVRTIKQAKFSKCHKIYSTYVKNMIGVYFNIKYTPAYFISSGIFSVNSVARFNSSTADHPLNRSAI